MLSNLIILDSQNQNILKRKVKEESDRSSPPQQKPAAPMADTPLLFKAAITDLAST